MKKIKTAAEWENMVSKDGPIDSMDTKMSIGMGLINIKISSMVK